MEMKMAQLGCADTGLCVCSYDVHSTGEFTAFQCSQPKYMFLLGKLCKRFSHSILVRRERAYDLKL
ncbi:hypothetical protein BDW22DRAFT_1362897, partial [Trametopsis cervina]